MNCVYVPRISLDSGLQSDLLRSWLLPSFKLGSQHLEIAGINSTPPTRSEFSSLPRHYPESLVYPILKPFASQGSIVGADLGIYPEDVKNWFPDRALAIAREQKRNKEPKQRLSAGKSLCSFRGVISTGHL